MYMIFRYTCCMYLDIQYIIYTQNYGITWGNLMTRGDNATPQVRVMSQNPRHALGQLLHGICMPGMLMFMAGQPTPPPLKYSPRNKALLRAY